MAETTPTNQFIVSLRTDFSQDYIHMMHYVIYGCILDKHIAGAHHPKLPKSSGSMLEGAVSVSTK